MLSQTNFVTNFSFCTLILFFITICEAENNAVQTDTKWPPTSANKTPLVDVCLPPCMCRYNLSALHSPYDPPFTTNNKCRIHIHSYEICSLGKEN